MPSPEQRRYESAEERFLTRMAELDAERRRVILTALRQYRIARRWGLAATCGAVLLTAGSLVQVAVGNLLQGGLGVIAGALIALWACWQDRRLRVAQRDAYDLLEGDDG